MMLIINPYIYSSAAPPPPGPTPELLLHFNGTNGATSYTDDGPEGHTIAFSSGAALSTSQKRFGTASVLFDGVDDYLTLEDMPNITTAFCIEGFFYANGNEGTIFNIPALDWSLDLVPVGDNFNVSFWNGSSAKRMNDDALTIGGWHHFVVWRNDASSTVRLGLDGIVRSGTGTFTSSATAASGDWLMGTYSDPYPCACYVDEFRVLLNNSGGYGSGSSYTVPTVAFV